MFEGEIFCKRTITTNMKNRTGISKRKMGRRSFIGASLTAFAAAGLTGKDKLLKFGEPREPSHKKIKEYRTLGRTGFKCSDISFGSSGAKNMQWSNMLYSQRKRRTIVPNVPDTVKMFALTMFLFKAC